MILLDLADEVNPHRQLPNDGVKHDPPLPCTTNHKPIVAKECELALQKTKYQTQARRYTLYIENEMVTTFIAPMWRQTKTTIAVNWQQPLDSWKLLVSASEGRGYIDKLKTVS